MLKKLIASLFFIGACSTASAATFDIDVTVDLNGLSTGMAPGNQPTFFAPTTASGGFTLQTGDILNMNFSFIGGSFKLGNNAGSFFNHERFGFSIAGVSSPDNITTRYTLSNVDFVGDLAPGTITGDVTGVGFISPRMITNITDTNVTMKSGTLSLEVLSGLDTPSSGTVGGFIGYGTAATVVPLPAPALLLLGAMGALGLARRKRG